MVYGSWLREETGWKVHLMEGDGRVKLVEARCSFARGENGMG